MLDGQGLNGHHWVFYGALSSVEYTLTVTDTATGLSRRYFNPSGQLRERGRHPGLRAAGRLRLDGCGRRLPRRRSSRRRAPSPKPLRGERHAALPERRPVRGRVLWKDFSGRTGKGQAVALTPDTGYFWFFDAANVEVVAQGSGRQAGQRQALVFLRRPFERRVHADRHRHRDRQGQDLQKPEQPLRQRRGHHGFLRSCSHEPASFTARGCARPSLPSRRGLRPDGDPDHGDQSTG